MTTRQAKAKELLKIYGEAKQAARQHSSEYFRDLARFMNVEYPYSMLEKQTLLAKYYLRIYKQKVQPL